MSIFSSLRARLGIAALIVLGGVLSAPILIPRLDTSLDPAPDSEAEVYEVTLSELTKTDGEIAALLTSPSDLTGLENEIQQLDAISSVTVQQSPRSADTHLLVATIAVGTSDDAQELLLEEFQTLPSDLLKMSK